MRIEEARAGEAAKRGARVQRTRSLREDVAPHRFFPAGAAAPLATKLSVECIERGLLGSKSVLVAFNRLRRELGVHRFEERHDLSVGQGW